MGAEIESMKKEMKKELEEDKFALLWGEAQKKIAYSYPRVTHGYPNVSCSGPMVNLR